MLGWVENIKIISSIKNQSKSYKKIQSRTAHGFVFRLKGYAEYNVNGHLIRVNAGEMAFLPKGSSYELFSSESSYISINFEADIIAPEISIYSLKEYGGAHSMFQRFWEIWNFGNTPEKYKCLSEFYDLIAYITRSERLSGYEKMNYRIIEPALEYLKSHLFDVDLKVSMLHNLCGVSDTYFRKIFMSRFTMSPRDYIQRERLEHAKRIIESDDYDSIGSVSEAVGYSDPLYFSKAFRKKYGVAPSCLR